MTIPINQALDHIAISGIRQFNDAVSGIPDMLKLTLGEPDFNTPAHIKQAAIQAIKDNYSHYTPNAGDPELRQAVSAYFADIYAIHYRASDQILVTVGATEALAAAILAATNPGDSVLLPAPAYPGYEPLLTLNHVTAILIDTSKNNFVLTPQLIEAAIAAHPDAHITGILLNYPNNPTGVTYRQAEVQALAACCLKHDLTIISDEIYAALTYGQPHISIAKYAKAHTILVSGLSKSHAMTGWRLGFLLAPAPTIAAIKKVHQYLVTAATTISQRAAIEALNNGREDSVQMNAIYQKRRDKLAAALQQLGFACARPDGAFYLFARIPASLQLSSRAFCTQLAQENHLAVIPGTAFGQAGQGYVRLSYAASDADLQEAVKRLSAFMTAHQ